MIRKLIIYLLGSVLVPMAMSWAQSYAGAVLSMSTTGVGHTGTFCVISSVSSAVTYRLYSLYTNGLERGDLPRVLRSGMAAIVPILPLLYTVLMAASIMNIVVGDVFTGIIDCLTTTNGFLVCVFIAPVVLIPELSSAVVNVLEGAVIARDQAQVVSEAMEGFNANHVRLALSASDAISDLVTEDRGALGLERDDQWKKWAAIAVASKEYTTGPPLKLVKDCGDALAALSADHKEEEEGVLPRAVSNMLEELGVMVQQVDAKSVVDIAAYVHFHSGNSRGLAPKVEAVAVSCDWFNDKYVQMPVEAQEFVEKVRLSRKRHAMRRRGNRVNLKSALLLAVLVPTGAVYISRDGPEKIANIPNMIGDKMLSLTCSWTWIARKKWLPFREKCGIDYKSYYNRIPVDKADGFGKSLLEMSEDLLGEGGSVVSREKYLMDIEGASKELHECAGMVGDHDFVAAGLGFGAPALLCGRMFQMAYLSMYCNLLEMRFDDKGRADECKTLLEKMRRATGSAANGILSSASILTSATQPAMVTRAMVKLTDSDRSSGAQSMGTMEMDMIINSTRHNLVKFSSSLEALTLTPPSWERSFNSLVRDVGVGVKDSFFWNCGELSSCQGHIDKLEEVRTNAEGLFDQIERWERKSGKMCAALDELLNMGGPQSELWRGDEKLEGLRDTCRIRAACTVSVDNIPRDSGWFSSRFVGTTCQRVAINSPLELDCMKWFKSLQNRRDKVTDARTRGFFDVVYEGVVELKGNQIPLNAYADKLAKAMGVINELDIGRQSVLVRMATTAIALAQIKNTVVKVMKARDGRGKFNLRAEDYMSYCDWGKDAGQLLRLIELTVQIKTGTWDLTAPKIRGISNMVRSLKLAEPQIWSAVDWHKIDIKAMVAAEAQRQLPKLTANDLAPGSVAKLAARRWYPQHPNWEAWRSHEGEISRRLEARSATALYQDRKEYQRVARALLPKG
jgi:hypothetical protein